MSMVGKKILAMQNYFKKNQLGKRFIDSCRFYKKRLYVFGAFSTAYGGIMYINRNHKNEIFRLALAGSFSTMLWEVGFHFADTVNIKSKLHNEKMSTVKMWKLITKQDGIYGFSKGISATFYGSIVCGFLYFSLYKFLK